MLTDVPIGAWTSAVMLDFLGGSQSQPAAKRLIGLGLADKSQIAQQVRIPGFRPGKAPARILDQRLGRGVVLEEVVNEVVPAKYGEAVPRQPRPNANRGDNLTGTSPYQDSDPELVADLPLVA